MRRTTVLVLALVFVIGGAVSVTAQKQVVDEKLLQGLLPGAPAGFKVNEPASGSTVPGPYGRVSRADVSFKTSDDVPRMIRVSIVDLAESMMATAAMHDIVNPTPAQSEEGYTKAVVMKGKYPGSEKATMGMTTFEVAFVVGDRFVVKAEGTRVDVKLLHALLEAMSVETLAKR